MQSLKVACIAIVVAAAGFCIAGCNSQPNTVGPTKKVDAHEHVHHGPHDGHLMEIGKEEYHAEWVHDDSGKVTFYILDAAAKKEVAIAADQITIDVKIGENPPKSYELVAVSPMDGKAAAFTIVDKPFAALFDQLKNNASLVLTLHVNINGKQFDQAVKEHEHHAH